MPEKTLNDLFSSQGEKPTTSLGKESNLTDLFKEKPKELQAPSFSRAEDTHNIDVSKYSDYLDGGVFDNKYLDEARARKQSIGEKWLHGAGKALSVAGTSIGEGAGIAGGLLGAIVTQDSDTIFKNPVVDFFSKVQHNVDEALPNYYTQQEEQNNVLENLGTANFWADKFLNGVGFAASSIIPGIGLTKAGNAFKAAVMLGKAGKASKFANFLAKAGLSSTKLETLLDGASTLNAAMVGRIGESGIEANQAYDQTYNELIAKGASHEQADALAKDARLHTFGTNMMLAIPDAVQFGKLFGNFRNSSKILSKSVRDKALGVLETAAIEAGEENLQLAISNTAKNLANKQFDTNSKTTTSDFLDSIAGEFMKNFTTKEGQESMLLGGLVGAGMTGVSSLGSNIVKKNTDNIDTRAAKNNITTFTQLEGLKNKAVAKGEVGLYKAAENLQFASWVKQKLDSGKFEDFTNELEAWGKTKPEELPELGVIQQDIDKFGIEKDPKKIADTHIEKAKNLKKILDNVDLNFPGVTSSVRDGLYYNISTQDYVSDKLNTLEEVISTEDVKKLKAESRGEAYIEPIEITKAKKEFEQLKLAKQDLTTEYQRLTNPEEQAKAKTKDDANTIEKQAQQEAKDFETKTRKDASEFYKANKEGFQSIQAFNDAIAPLPKNVRSTVLKNYKDLISKTVINDPDVLTQDVTINGELIPAKEIPETARPFLGNNQYVSLGTGKLFNADAEQSVESTDTKDKEVIPQKEIIPIGAIKVEKYTPSKEKPTVVRTQNTEFRRSGIKNINGEDYVVIETNNGVPVINQYDKEFGTDFNFLSTPGTLQNGTLATIELLNHETVGKVYLVKVDNKVVGKLSIKDKPALIRVLEARLAESKNTVKINGKWGSSAIHTEKTDTSLNDIKTLSPQNLPDSKIIIGTIKGNVTLFPKDTKDEHKPNLNNPVNGHHFVVLTTPEGIQYPEILWNTPVKDIKIGDKTIGSILIGKIDKFLTDLNNIENKKDELSNARTKWQSFRKANVDPITNFGISVKEKYSLDLNLVGDNYVLSLRKGNKEDKNYSKGTEVFDDITNRFFNINSDLLEENKPFTFEGIDYSSYIDFLVDNKIVTTSIYPQRPFAFTELDIDTEGLTNIQPEIKVTKLNKIVTEPISATEESKTELDPKKAAALAKLKKAKSDPSNTLTRPLISEQYEIWDQKRELEWMHNVLPQIPVDIAKSTSDIYRKFGVRAHGIFSNAVIYLANNSEVGTTYHEAFHAVFNLYLSNLQKSSILESLRTNKNQTDLQLEEIAAEQFRDFILIKKEPSNKLIKFFNDILIWIRNQFGLLQAHDLYNRIVEGKYANAPLTKNADQFVMRTRLIPTFNASEQKRRLDVTMKLLFDELTTLQNKKDILNIDFDSITTDQLDEVFENVKTIWEVDSHPDAQKVFNHFNDFKVLAIKEFQKYGLNINPNYIEKVDEEKQEQEEKANDTIDRIYSKAAFESSQKDTISKEIKLYLATIPKVTGVKEGQFEYDSDDLGFTRFLDFHDIYNYISDSLIGLETIDEMIKELEDLSIIKPELHKIIYDLKKNPSQENTNEVDAEKFRHKFFTTFSNQYIEFLTLSKNKKEYNKPEGKDRRYFFNVYETNKRSLQRQIVSKWVSNYEDVTHDTETYNKLIKITKDFKTQLNNPENFEGLNSISQLLKTIGIDMSEDALVVMKKDFFKNNPNNNFINYLIRTDAPTIGVILKAHSLGKNIYSGINGDESTNEEIGERKAVNELAKFEKLVHVDRANASFLNGQNKTVYAINSNHYASKLFNRLKENTDDIINKFLEVPYMKHSKILKDIQNDKLKKEFKLYVFDTIFDNDSKFEGITYDELDTLQSVAVKFNMFNNRGSDFGYFHIPTPSDRGNIQAVKLTKLNSKDNEVIFDENGLNPNSQFYKWLLSSIEDEYTRIKQTVEEWDGLNPIKNYHISKNGGRGNAYYFNQFYDLNKFYNLESYYKSGDALPTFDAESPELHAFLNDNIKKQFLTERRKLRDAGLLQLDKEGNVGPKTKETSKLLDDKIKLDNITVDNYVANYYYANTELTKILSGDIAYYKGEPHTEIGRADQIADMNKRFGQSFVPGRDLSVSTESNPGGAKTTFNLAISEDNELASKYITDYAKSIYSTLSNPESVNFEKLFDKNGNFNTTEIYLRNLLGGDINNGKAGGYLKNNQTDAQGYITLARLRNIMEGQGTFSGKYKDAWDRLNNNGTDINDYKTVFQPIKGFYYNQEFKNGLAVPTQVKYSTVPLIPSFVNKYPTLKNLLAKMEEAGVDEFVFESGIKAGVQNKNTIDTLANDNKLQFITLSNKNWRIPQTVPYKSKTKENFGSQIRKLITSNLNNETYTLFGTKKNGNDIISLYQNILRANIKEGFDKLIPRFQNVEEISKMLLEEIQGSNTRSLPETYEKGLEYNRQTKDTRISLDFPLIKRKIENILNSLFDKKVVKQEIPGFAAVQVSSFGVATTSNDLEFVRLEDGKVKPAEVLVSPQYFLNVLKKQKLDITKFVDDKGNFDIFKISDNLLKVVLYRIPTQGKNSMLPAKIKGFLPSEAGSQIIIPFEVTTQAGSDYDIDKVYIEMYNFDNDLKKVQYDDKLNPEENSLAARQNAIIDIHYSILTDAKHFAELITPNNSRTLKALKDKIAEAFPDKSKAFWHNLWVQEDLRSKNQAGKQLVGVYSIQSTSHSIAQDLDMSMKSPVYFNGMSRSSLSYQRNIDGNLISDDLSERQTAAVDNAKEPILGGLNDNKFTSSVIAMIIRVGYGNALPSYLVNQPIIRYLTTEYQKAESSQSAEKALETAIDKCEKKYDIKIERDLTKVTPTNFDLKYLEEHITDNHKNTKGVVHHKNVLETFLKYKESGDALSRVSNALAIDTKGTSATIAENISNLNNLKDAFTNPYVYINRDKYNDYSIEHYAKYGVEEANNAIKQYLPLDTSILMTGVDEYRGILTKLETLKDARLSPEEINKVIYDFYTYLHTHSNSNFSNITNSFKLQLLTGEKSLSNRLKQYVKDHPTDLNLFIGSLSILGKDKVTGFDLIGFNNTGARTPEEKNTIMYSLLDLYNGSTEDQKLARDLTVYSFITFGFSRGVDTFIDYIPLEIYEKIGIIDFYKDIKKSFDSPMFDGEDIFNSDNFINQYIQNNFKELSFVEKIPGDKLKEANTNPDAFSEYIATQGTNRLFKKTSNGYVELNKLGYPNKLKEYSMEDNNLQSIIESNAVAGKKQKQRTSEPVAIETLTTILDKLKDRFGINYDLVNDFSLDYAGAFENGKVIINTAKAGLDTPFHEFAHPFISVIKQERPALYKNLVLQIQETEDGKAILNEVQTLYPISSTFSKEDQIEEAIVQAIGKYASNNINPSTGKGLISAIKTFLSRIAEYLRNLLSSDVTVTPSELDPNLTLEDLATIMSIGESKVDLGNENLANEFGLINKDGSRKKYSTKDYTNTLGKVQQINRKLNSNNSPFTAKIVKIKGEKGDNRIYDTISFKSKTKYQKTKSEYNKGEKETSFAKQDSFFNKRLFSLQIQLDKQKEGSDTYNRILNEINDLKSKLKTAFEAQSQPVYKALGEEILKKAEEFIISLEQGKAIDKDKSIIFTNDTINVWKDFPELESESAKLQRRLYPFFEKNIHEEVSQYANEKETPTIEDINSQDKDIDTFKKGVGSLSDLSNYIGRTIGSIIKAAQNRISTHNKLIAKDIQSEVDKLANYAKSVGMSMDEVYDLFIQEGNGTSILTKKYKGEELNPDYQTIQNTPELKRFYEFYQNTIETYQKGLPVRVSKYFIPNIKKETLKGKLKDHNPIKERKVGKGFEEDSLSDVVPIQYIKKLPSEEKSTNLGASLLQFAMSSNNYTEMSEVLPKVRLIQEGLKYQKDSNGNIREKTFKKSNNPNLIISGEKSNLYKMVDDVIEMQVKGKMKSEEWKHVLTDIFDEQGNKVGEKYIDMAGIADDALSYNSLLRIGLSPITAISNVLFGDISNSIEALGGRFMTVKGLTQATNIFFRQTFNEGSTLNQLLEELNPLQELDDYDSIEQVKLAGKTAKLSTEKLREYMYSPQKKGEKYLQSRTMLAVMIKDGYLTSDGKVTDKYINASAEEKQKLSDKIQRLNQLIHGRYSQKEAATLQQHVLYRLISQFRKWIPAAIENRIGAKQWDNRLQAEIEGRYLTFGRLLLNLKDTIERLKSGQMTDLEVYNTKKMVVELILLASSILLYAGLHGGDDDEDKKWRKNPMVKTTLTLLNRISGDIDFFYNPASITGMAQKAVPLAKTLEDLGTAIIYIPYAFYIEGSEYKTGSRKGQNKFYSKAGSVIPGAKVIGDIKRLANDRDLEELR